MNDENKNAVIGARIMQRRKLLGMKQSELAELIGVSDNQISNIENGRSYPKLNSFMLICKALDCNADYFFSGVISDSLPEQIGEMLSSLSVARSRGWSGALLTVTYIRKMTQRFNDLNYLT